jgi:hypothetical protein
MQNLKKQEAAMTRVLLIGYEPEAVDFSNPALPAGMTPEKIRAGIALALKQMTDRGWEGDVCYIRPDGTAGQAVERDLASAKRPPASSKPCGLWGGCERGP